jgi:hypothetical protein
VVYSCSVLIFFSWVCHFDWQEQIAADATDAEEPYDMGSDVVEPDARPEVYCQM